MVGRDEAELILVGDLIARIIAQTCRQSGLSVVYTELLDFDGDEIYMAEPPAALVGPDLRRGAARVRGLDRDRRPAPAATAPRLNPPMDTLDRGRRPAHRDLRATTTRSGRPTGPDRRAGDDRIVAPHRRDRARPERTLVLGWNWRGPAIVRELDAYVAPGSEVLVVADEPDVEASLAGVRRRPRATRRVEVRHGDTTDRDAPRRARVARRSTT